MSPQDRPLGPAATPIVTLGAVSRPGKSKAEECGRTLTTLCLGVRFGVSKKNFSSFILGVVSLSSFISVPCLGSSLLVIILLLSFSVDLSPYEKNCD
jgi:hypothetical protein